MFYTAEVNTDIGHFSVTQVTNSRLSVVKLALQTLETLVYQMKNDPRSCASNICNCIRSLKKKSGLQQDLNSVLAIPVDALINLTIKPLMLGAGQLRFHIFPRKR